MRRSLFRPQRCDAIPAQFVALWETREPAVLFQQLKDQHHLLKLADLQGNTLLHYAVTTPPNGALIKFLLAVPVDLKAQNCAGETAADWLRPYIKSSKVLLDPTELDQLPERIATGDSDFVTDLLIKEKISLRLRFSQGDTLLHLLIRHDQYKIVQQLISNTAGQIIEYLLKISNGVGETPLTILQAQLQQGKPEAQAAIDAALQHRNKETALPPCFPSVEAMISLLHLSVTDMEKLNKLFSAPVSVENFAQLQPYLPTLCVLAYRLCKSAGRVLSSSSCEESYMPLLQQLFGQWHDSILVNLLSRINAIDRFISYIVSNNCVEQSIVLSAGNPDHTGWSDSSTAKIYLNPTGTAHLMDVLLTLLHEVSHQAVSSYDLVCEGRSIVKEDYYQINFKGCYDLATKGEGIASLSEECMDLLSVYWQLESGEVTDGSTSSLLKLYQKFALNNADSLAIAIFGLAAFNSGYATLDEENHILQIDQQFLFRR
jgi:hypothetical protein